MGPSPNLTAPSAGNASKYHTLMELGRGGTAVVHAALARGLAGFSKVVVLKKTRQELSDNPSAVRMFLNEARLSARMNHPNVVQVYEVFEDQGLPVIVMEYLEGQSLAVILRRLWQGGDYPSNVVLSVLCKALEGLRYAHSLTDFSGRPLKIIHRDVTPHNIIVTYDGQVKLLDFGIAKLDASSGETRTGIIKGKLGYMPREQVDGTELDCRADIFAIGVILWEVVARQRMWGTLSDANVMKNLLCDEIPALRPAAPHVDPELEHIVTKAIAPEREDRYADADELLSALTAYLERVGGTASQATMADLVAKCCADLRADARQRLDRELAKFSQTADGNWDALPAEFTISGARTLTQSDETTDSGGLRDTGTRTGFVGQADALTVRPVRRIWPAFAAIGTLALAGAAAWLMLPRERPIAVNPPAPAAAPAETPARAPEVQLTLRATPGEAELYLDGKRLPSNPYEASVLPDQLEHVLEIKAEGFEPLTRKVRFESDLSLELALAPSEPAAPAGAAEEEEPKAAQPVKVARRSPRKRPSPAPVAVQAPAPPAPKASPAVDPCTTPYYLDKQGIKRYKRECLGK